MNHVLLAAFLLTWEPPPCEPDPLTYRVEQVHIYQIATVPDMDDDGNVIGMPVYVPWTRVLVQEGPETEAAILCTPWAGEVCIGIVTAIDEAGNEDLGENCVDTGGD